MMLQRTSAYKGTGSARAVRGERGAVLMEVVMALVLFVAAAAVITGGLHASLQSVERLRLTTHAGNLAVSLLSEVQIGVRPAESIGPEPWEAPFEQWTFELVVDSAGTESTSAGSLRKIEAIVRHAQEDIVYRLTQVMSVPAGETVAARPSRSPQLALSGPHSPAR